MIHHVEVQVLVLLLVAAFVGMGARRFRLPYTLALVVAGLRGGGADVNAEDLLRAEIDGGPVAAARAAAELLARAFMVPGEA